jgi:predicted amidohydrolase
MSITLSIVQFCPKYADLDYNIEFLIDKIKDDDSDIIVFPELALSGYFFTKKSDLSDLAIRADGEIISQFQKLSQKLDKVIVFGFVEKDKSSFYNSAAILLPDINESSIYRKSHLFYKERLVFEQGNTGFFNVYWSEKDVNIGTMICYDWRFPEAARTLALKGADLILCPANLVTGVWEEPMRTRALENKVYVAVINRTGYESINEETLEFNGKSTIISYNGKSLISAGEDNEIILTSELSPEKTRDKSFNDINNIFLDRRPELYK